MASFPADLAQTVANRWRNIVGGDRYIVPSIPSVAVLTQVLEASYLAAATQEEGRYPHFNLLVVPKGTKIDDLGAVPLSFDQPRALSVSELRRLAPCSDLKKSAVWVEFDDESAVITGLADLGTSWYRAKIGFTYNYRIPHSLIVQVDRPGRMKVYQGQFHVATLTDGDLAVGRGVDFHLFLHDSVKRGLSVLGTQFVEPEVEEPRDFTNFWFTAHWNVFAAIANSISLSGHGGTLVIADQDYSAIMSCLRVKYSGTFNALQNAFISFINARNKTADFYETAERQDKPISTGVFEAETNLTATIDQLVEAIRFVAHLSSCDGAIVISPALSLLGFGAEIRAEMRDCVTVQDVISEMSSEYAPCDIEQFGMRHRSAIKLASHQEGTVVLAVSQDGPITAVWRKQQTVFVKRSVSLGNLNMPWMDGP